MSLGLVGKHSKRRPVEPRRFDFIRWTVILLLATARLSLAQADTGAGSYTDINAEHSYSGITGLLPKTFGEPAPAAETSVRFGAACALPISLSLIPASLAGPDASPIFPLNHVCDSLRDAFAEGSENAVSSVSEPPLARLDWSAPSQTFLFTLERRLESPAFGLAPGNNKGSVTRIEDQPFGLAQETLTADDSACSLGPSCNTKRLSMTGQDQTPPAGRTPFAPPSTTRSNALARAWSGLLWPFLLALVAAVGWLLCKRWRRYDQALIHAARAGLRRREFHLEYQPVVSLRHGRCVGGEALLRCQRGDITIWFTEEALAAWRPAKTGARGRQQEYSDLAIETALFIRQVFHLPLRQTEGFMNSLSRIMKAIISIPDYSSISKRSISIPMHVLSQAMDSGSLVIVDSTGLKVYGKDEWHQEKHDVPARRTWRKLHLAIHEHLQVLVCELTTPDDGDPSAVADLLTQIVTPFETFIGEGACDVEPVSQAVLNHQPNAQVVIYPHKTAVLSTAGDTQRDHHIEGMAQQRRLPWQRITGYNLRNYAELAMQRHQRIFGNTMKARALPQQKTEAWISVSALNGMTNLGQARGIYLL
ncbi:IS5 family transposase [Caballeronia sp. LjRoot31]|jgi:hypothetical protein|uniref:IS5 family transposase n=1 Tax=Caballeronia sp. LjRoot31 TaxID=3342324 RepID=UPI003ECDB92B